MAKYLAALDQGTTSSRTVIFSEDGRMIASCNKEFPQHYPKPGWVEHDPRDILNTQVASLQEAVRLSGVNPAEIAAVGITNQRETTFLWDRQTGECVGNAIVWQCRRTSPMVDDLVSRGCGDMIREKTGLVPDAYFSGTKLKWMLDYYNLRDKAEKGNLCFGTADSFLCWNLLENRPHVTDATNAGRTMLFNLHTQEWDEDLLRLLEIPRACLPRVVDSSGPIGMLDPAILGRRIPVTGMAGDQHASLFGQACLNPGDVKNTYGTGCFMLMNTGNTPVKSRNGLLTTMAWRIGGKPVYALEGSVFMGGATIQWLRDELKIISHAAESEALAQSVTGTGGVYLVPAFTGLGAPWWDSYSRGTLIGMTRGTGRPHIVRAALEAIAYQSADLMDAMAKDCGQRPERLQVDGGASANAFLMQFQADISAIPVVRPKVLETTALGAALLAGLGAGVYASTGDTAAVWQKDLEFTPQIDEATRRLALGGWHKAVERSLGFARD